MGLEQIVPPDARPIARTGRMELELLGGFELRHRGQAVTLPHAAERVLVFLAVHQRALRRPYVAGSLWPNVPEARAGGNLRSVLWRLRALDAGAVEATPATIRLPAEVRIDLRDRVELAHGLAGAPPGGPDELVRLAADFEMDLLPDWYDEWLVEWRERWHEVRVHALEEIARALLAAGRCGPAIEVALTAAGAEPLRESAHRLVIEAHLAEGNAEAAARHFRAYARHLDADLGVAPSSRIAALVAGLAAT